MMRGITEILKHYISTTLNSLFFITYILFKAIKMFQTYKIHFNLSQELSICSFYMYKKISILVTKICLAVRMFLHINSN